MAAAVADGRGRADQEEVIDGERLGSGEGGHNDAEGGAEEELYERSAVGQ